MQTSQKLKTTTPANENQADFGRKDTKINTPEFTQEFIPGSHPPDSQQGNFSSLAFLSGAIRFTLHEIRNTLFSLS